MVVKSLNINILKEVFFVRVCLAYFSNHYQNKFYLAYMFSPYSEGMTVFIKEQDLLMGAMVGYDRHLRCNGSLEPVRCAERYQLLACVGYDG